MQTINKQSITIDLIKSNTIQLPTFIQGDTNILEMYIKSNNVDVDLSTIGKIVVNYLRSDKKVFTRLLKGEGNIVTYQIGNDEMKTAGYGEIELQFFSQDNTERISTKRMQVYMTESIGNDNAFEGSEGYTALQELFQEVETVKTNAETATTNANTATDNANTATTSANNAATNATTQANYAKSQGDYAKQQGDDIQSTVDAQNSRIDNIVAQAGTDNTEIVDARLGADGTVHPVLKSRLDKMETQLVEANKQTQTISHGTSIINSSSDVSSPIKVEFYCENSDVDVVNPFIKIGSNSVTINTTLTTNEKVSFDSETNQCIKTKANGSTEAATFTKVGTLSLAVGDNKVEIGDVNSAIKKAVITYTKPLKSVVDEHSKEITNTKTQVAQIQKQLQTGGLYYDSVAGEYKNIDVFWNSLRQGKKYTVEFTHYSVSPSSNGVKLDDNAGLFCEPSTNTFKGRNDYENIGLFMSIDVNAYVDANDNYHVTAIKGDGRFKADGTNGDVYVMAMAGYIKHYKDETSWGITYADVQFAGFEIIDEAVKPDGTIRPYLLHAKYVAGRNPLDNQLASISGVYPEYTNMSHNDQITKFQAKGLQYSGKTTHDDFYVQLMMWLKYATMNSQDVMAGCTSYYNQYVASIAETNVKRIIISNSNATGIEVGSCVSIGDYNGSTKTDDRQQARNYSLANRVKVLSKEPLSDGVNTAINLDVTVPFTTSLTSTITTYPWFSGACDNVQGQDGSPSNNLSGREPFIINGIEMMVGGYEILANVIINNNNTDPLNYKVEVYANYDCKTYATSITTAYDLVGELAQTNSSWSYLTETEIKDLHPSLILPVATGGSSSTGYGDGIYTNSPTSGTREWLSLGGLNYGSFAGLRCLYANGSLGVSTWNILGRLSPTGRSRRRAGVN
ncbi:hypothetical protein [Schinkia azotoformans]|uniref:hypothetical protein n=1 Tax=Schinkia azotoformans TaxID=1454 RepID=UPI002DBD4501|nr:hypothetical protein [Schinkia azotoformans]MEC1778397.1 hypothetical protein [Schinkia azotoformans]MED4328358.1 hypothetical protein [Schinkia azotoformans]